MHEALSSRKNRGQSKLAPEFAGRIADTDPAEAGTAGAGGEQKLKSDHCVLKWGGNPSGNGW